MIINNAGYILIRNANGKLVPKHRVVMEKHIGRPLNPGEVVHHINEDKTDNRIKNLLLMGAKEHAIYHINKRNLYQTPLVRRHKPRRKRKKNKEQLVIDSEELQIYNKYRTAYLNEMAEWRKNRTRIF